MFSVDSARKSDQGEFLWPGYGEEELRGCSSRVIERVAGTGAADETPIGYVPTVDGVDRSGLDLDDTTMAELLRVDDTAWQQEVAWGRGPLRVDRRAPARRDGHPARRPRQAPRGLSPPGATRRNRSPIRGRPSGAGHARWSFTFRSYTRPVSVSAYILVQTEVGTAARVADQIRALPGVLAADDVIGPYDVITRCTADSVDDLGRLVAGRMQMIAGVVRTTTCTVVHL